MASKTKTADAETVHPQGNPGHQTGTVAHEGAAGGGFPPFNPDTFAPQLIWLALTFVALYYLLSKIALPRIGEVIEERSERIQRDLDLAERMKADTEAALAAYEQALADARGKAGTIAKDMRERLSAEADRERGRVEGQLATKIAEAETRIATTKAKALASVTEIAEQTVGDVVSTVSGISVSAEEVKRALSAASK